MPLFGTLFCVALAAGTTACTQSQARPPQHPETKPAHPITVDKKPAAEAKQTKTNPQEPKKTTIGERFKDAPFATLLTPPPTVALKAGGEIPIYATQCGACHSDIYKEWSQSTHAAALGDPQYIAELSKKSSPRWLCLNCHIPLQAQREYIVDDKTAVWASAGDVRKIEKKGNKAFDPRLQKEAITCATCHVRADKDGKGTIHGPRGSDIAPHRVVKSDVPKNMCVRCHDPGAVQLTTTFLCWFETRREALAAGEDATCKTCHMPAIKRPTALGAPARDTVRHTFVGPVPKTYTGFLTRDARGFVPGVEVSVARTNDMLRITLKNENAAHHVPSADPERHLLLEIEQTDANGKRVTRAERIGQQWDWGDADAGRVAQRTRDNRLAAGQSRGYNVDLTGMVDVHITLRHVRLTEENRAHMMTAVLDDELRKLAPTAAADLAHMPERYPAAATLYRAVYDVKAAELSETPMEELAPLDAAAR